MREWEYDPDTRCYRVTDRTGAVAEVWKDPRRPGYRGQYRNVELCFIASPEAAMAHLDREMEARRL